MRNSLLLVVLGVVLTSVLGQQQQSLPKASGDPSTPPDGTAFEEVVVETSFYVKGKPAAASLRQQRILAAREKGIVRTRREISHGTELMDGSPLKSNALSPVVGHQKHSQQQQDFMRSFFDKGFNNGAAKAEHRAFHKQKTVTKKQSRGNTLN
uniref:Putative conserved secreted protein n=1 Tax=Culex tarsalis TaxID=7177 RepID=A0A1Q3FPB0_CULTA